MAGFYFSRVPKFKIKSGRGVSEQENISPQPLELRTGSVPEVVVPQASKATTGRFLHYSVSAENNSGRFLHCHDELDPAILERLPPSSATAAASIHKYRTSVWARATEGANISELIKMAKMNTARSHVLNCELYKDLAMKVDELRSIVVGTEDIDALRLRIKPFVRSLQFLRMPWHEPYMT
ncbi:hypothetical protein Fot_06276 [Forsythia ovata]|uniref:Uncharacterized protein n=1 Tax=Forsythia ovata TaxID=205694 RepID=A0ABD1WSH6_9LAMI